MGQFSWMFADADNNEALDICMQGYLCLPDSEVIREPCYEGYGVFGGRDVYDLVADWNRGFLANHPDFIIKQHEMTLNPKTHVWEKIPDKKVSEMYWYPAYADLSKSRAEVEEAVKALEGDMAPPGYIKTFEYRYIGIDIACYDDQNAALPYPIKICRRRPYVPYNALPASTDDPNQGMGGDWR